MLDEYGALQQVDKEEKSKTFSLIDWLTTLPKALNIKGKDLRLEEFIVKSFRKKFLVSLLNKPSGKK